MRGLLVLGCRLAVGGIFIYASLDKLAHPQAFAEVIHHYRLTPYPLLHPSAHLLPVLEFVIGSALVLGIWRRGAALLAGVLTVFFMVAITSALIRNLDISCGCFNTDGGHAVGLDLLFRDGILLLLCLPPLLARESGIGLDRFFRK
ncbi:MAG: DoxX family membrane protein [Candidatus Krumholzibacteria bacterium]|nr:DoxX family membrane protein [Candidatus Krumholzibacteria bacterium]